MKPVFLAALLFFPIVSHASDLTQKVQETYRHTDQFRADFIQTTKVELLDREVREKGEIFFAKPESFLIHYLGPRERKYICNGKTLWIYRPREKEVEVYDNVGDILSREALVFLGGLGEMTKEFKVKIDAENGLTLIPKNSRSLFLKIFLVIDPATFLVSEVVLFPKTGNQSHYLFSSVRTNVPISPQAFEFHESGVRATYEAH
jgi:outer membrane lipoprotein carrier protein